MITNPNIQELLAGVDYGEYDAEASIRELEELAKTAKANVVAVLIQRKAAIDSTCLGKESFELKELCDTQDINLVIFDHELTAVS